jgi:porphobilinogen synthase
MPRRRSRPNLPIAAPRRAVRLRRLRRASHSRNWVAEGEVELRRLVLPVFVRPGRGAPQAVPSMPGVYRYSLGHVPPLARELLREGISSVLLFGVGRTKDAEGSDAWASDGIVPAAVRALKRTAPELVVATDVCLCAYTSHGHCGVIQKGAVANDATCDRLARVAVAHARAGADVVAPSAMMDGQVGWIGAALDGSGLEETAIMAYSTKHASAFYGPFREAEESAPSFGDRRGYQMDPRNSREALREMELDVAEGADILMVKPAMTSLDLLARAREHFSLPLAAYQVSGEYSMLKLAAARGIVDEQSAVMESLNAIRRAGADLVITYFAREVARWTRGKP